MADFTREVAWCDSANSGWIAGIDEAGRGPIAGPVSVAAVVFHPDCYSDKIWQKKYSYLNDSKRLTKRRRAILYRQLMTDNKVQYSHLFIAEQVIDKINILQATHYGMRKVATLLQSKITHRCGKHLVGCLIDGLPVQAFPLAARAITKGDSKSLSIAAASIIAKVRRDYYMIAIHQKFPHYGFDKHKGYPTAMHLKALRSHGSCSIHRQSFQPVSQQNLPGFAG